MGKISPQQADKLRKKIKSQDKANSCQKMTALEKAEEAIADVSEACMPINSIKCYAYEVIDFDDMDITLLADYVKRVGDMQLLILREQDVEFEDNEPFVKVSWEEDGSKSISIRSIVSDSLYLRKDSVLLFRTAFASDANANYGLSVISVKDFAKNYKVA